MFNSDFNEGKVKFDYWYIRMFKIIFASQGIINPILRCSEPSFLQIVTKKFKIFFCFFCRKNEIVVQQEALQTAEDRRFINRASRFV